MSLSWDGSVNVGTILGLLTIALAVIKYGNRMSLGMELAQRDVAELKKDMQDMKPKVDAILTLQANQGAFDQRLGRLEAKLDVMGDKH